jgi:laccase
MTVNGQFPGPALEVKEGDSLIVRVSDQPGRVQRDGSLARRASDAEDGVVRRRARVRDAVPYTYVRPGGSYTYRFTVSGQEGTLYCGGTHTARG